MLVSAELYGRHFYAGSAIRRRVCIVNDSENAEAIPPSRFAWEITCGGAILAGDAMPVPPVKYYKNHWINVAFSMPKDLPAPRTNAQLLLKLEANGKLLSQNSYDIVLATHDWAKPGEMRLDERSYY